MKALSFWIIVLATSCQAAWAGAETSPDSLAAPPVQLSSAYVVLAGDMAAIAMMSNLPAARAIAPGIDGAISCAYDRTAGKLVVSVYGDLNGRYFGALRPLERAKAALDYFRTKVLPILEERAAAAHEVIPSESDLRLVYISTFGGLREVVRWEDGKYFVSK
jgi:hypothetical protein